MPSDIIRNAICDIQFSRINRFTFTRFSDNVDFIFENENKTFKAQQKSFRVFLFLSPFTRKKWKASEGSLTFGLNSHICCFETTQNRWKNPTLHSRNRTCWFFNSFERNLFIEKIQESLGSEQKTFAHKICCYVSGNLMEWNKIIAMIFRLGSRCAQSEHEPLKILLANGFLFAGFAASGFSKNSIQDRNKGAQNNTQNAFTLN